MPETPASWQPDPYGRFAQRYFDGTNWTANVVDSSGAQFTDPPGPSAPTSFAPSSATASSTSSPPVPGLIVAGVGAVLLLLSLFVLNWFDFSSSFKEEINSASDQFEQVLGIKASEVTDGIKMREVKDIADADKEGDGLPVLSEQYLNWGYLAAIAAIAFAFVALFVPNLRLPAITAAALLALWHTWVVWDLSGDTVDTQLGAWLGTVGLVLAVVALVLPRQMSVARAT